MERYADKLEERYLTQTTEREIEGEREKMSTAPAQTCHQTLAPTAPRVAVVDADVVVAVVVVAVDVGGTCVSSSFCLFLLLVVTSPLSSSSSSSS